MRPKVNKDNTWKLKITHAKNKEAGNQQNKRSNTHPLNTPRIRFITKNAPSITIEMK